MLNSADEIKQQSPSPALLDAINAVLIANPYWRTEGIRIGGDKGMLAAIRSRGLQTSTHAIRIALRSLGLKTVGFGMVAAGLPSRERLQALIEQVLDSKPEWRTNYIKIRGENGMLAELSKLGYKINHEVIRRKVEAMGYHPWPRGVHYAAVPPPIPQVVKR